MSRVEWHVTVSRIVDGKKVPGDSNRIRIFDEPIRILPKSEYERLKRAEGKT